MKPCPFCGGLAIVRNGMGEHWGNCTNEACDASGPVRSTIADAIAAWDYRHGPLVAKCVGCQGTGTIPDQRKGERRNG